MPGSFGGSDCGACTYLRDCLLLAEPAPICQIICCCLLNWRSVPGSFGLCFSFFVIRFGDAPAICGIPGHQTYRLYQHAGQFRTFFRLLWHRISDPPAICGISRPREGVPGSFSRLFAEPPAICGTSQHRSCRLYRHAGQLRALFRLLWRRMSDAPTICGVSGHQGSAAL